MHVNYYKLPLYQSILKYKKMTVRPEIQLNIRRQDFQYQKEKRKEETENKLW